MKESIWARRAVRLRIVLVVCLVTSSLAGAATTTPAKTIRVPETLMRSVTFDGALGRIALTFQPTHIGFTWEGSHDSRVSYRTIDESGHASKWRVAPMNHDMETRSTLYTALIAVARPVSVEYRKELEKGKKAGGEWMGPITMESINTLDGPKREVALTSTAQSDPAAPPIVTRSEWGADETLKSSTGGCKRTFHPLRQIFVHHTAGSNYDRNGASTMRAIYAYHTQSRGWCDIGYNFVIDWNGTIYEGRWPRNYAHWETHDSEDYRNHVVTGAHVGGFNSGSVGISLMGNFMRIGPPAAMKTSLKAMLAWEADRHGLNPTGTHTFNGRRMRVIAGHRDAGQTACPGNKLYAQLPKLRRKAKARIGDGRRATRLTLDTSEALVPYGRSVKALGTLVDASGKSLANRPVTLHRKYAGGRWKQHSALTTGSKGRFATMLTPHKKVSIAASFSTRPSYWGSNSRFAQVRVKHLVTVAPTDRNPDSAGLYHYATTEKRAVIGGRVRPSHVGKSVRVRLFRRSPKGSGYNEVAERWPTLDGNGRFVHSFFLPNRKSDTRYRVAAKLPEDGAHEGGFSGSKYLVVD
ncbi:MAG: peptidoglycan recognition protein family protein [Actinomycetota bacterium]